MSQSAKANTAGVAMCCTSGAVVPVSDRSYLIIMPSERAASQVAGQGAACRGCWPGLAGLAARWLSSLLAPVARYSCGRWKWLSCMAELMVGGRAGGRGRRRPGGLSVAGTGGHRRSGWDAWTRAGRESARWPTGWPAPDWPEARRRLGLGHPHQDLVLPLSDVRLGTGSSACSPSFPTSWSPRVGAS